MELNELAQDRQHIINMDPNILLERDIYDELIVRAVIVLLTLMKTLSTNLKKQLQDPGFSDSPTQTGLIAELEMLQADYLEFEENMDEALTNDEIKAHLKESARNIIQKHCL